MAEITAEQRRALARARARMRLNQAPEPDIPKPGFISPALEHGLSLNLSDELAGAAKATRAFLPESMGGRPFSEISDLYTQGREQEKRRLEAQKAESPVSATIQDIGGSVVGGGAFKKGTGVLATTFEKLPKWLQTTGLGALWGGAQGAATAEPGERLGSAGTGAGLGAVGGALIHGGTKAVAAGGKGLRAYVTALTNPQKQADRILANALSADEVTRIPQRLEILGPNAMLADIGDEATRGVARGVAGTPGAPRRAITKPIVRRSAGSQGRLEAEVRSKIGPTDYFDAEERFLEKLSRTASDKYGQAYKAHPNVMSDDLRLIIADGGKDVRSGLSAAQRIAQNEGDTLSAQQIAEALRSPDEVGGLSLQAWDHVKRGLDNVAQSGPAMNKTTGGSTALGRSVKGVTKRLLDALDEATGGADGLYARARKSYGGDIEIVGALQDGKKIHAPCS